MRKSRSPTHFQSGNVINAFYWLTTALIIANLRWFKYTLTHCNAHEFGGSKASHSHRHANSSELIIKISINQILCMLT